MNAHRHGHRILSPISGWSRSPGILAGAAGMLLFLLIAGVLIRHDQWTSLDMSALQWLQSRRSPHGITFFSGLTFFGETPFLAFVGLVGALFLVRKRQLVLLTAWWIALIGGGVLE